jgi:transcription antitermination protein NusB
MKVTRRHAREVALQILFQHDLNPEPSRALDEKFAAERLKYPELEKFAMSLVEGVRENWREIDRILERHAQNWSVERMPTLDRNVLRLAVYEIKFAGTPPKVAVNEAIELSRKFSTEESTAFINGVLDALAGLGGRNRIPPPPSVSDEPNVEPPPKPERTDE